MIKAKKDVSSTDTHDQKKINEEEVLNDLIKHWKETSQKILLMMHNNEEVFTKNKNSKSVMAFGAMGAHINMALQALKSTGSEQWESNILTLLHKKLKQHNVLFKKYN